MGPFDPLPIWATALLLLATLLGACELGFRLRRRRPPADAPYDGYILSAAFGLLALLVGFTFSLALGRHEASRTLVLDEANAIGTAYLRAQLAPEPYRGELLGQLRRYTDARLALAAAGEDTAAIGRADAAAHALHQQLWATTGAAVPAMQPATLTPHLVAAVNETIDLAASRKAALGTRLPTSVLATLVLYAIMSAGILGHVLGGAGRRTGATTTILFVLLTLAVALILDLDRTRTGSITVSQTPLAALRASMAPP